MTDTAGGGGRELRILVDVGHPAHVHFFRHPIAEWRRHGHEVRVTSRAKDVTVALLDALGLPHRTLTRVGRGTAGLGREWLRRTFRLRHELRAFRADVVTAIGGGFIAPAGRLAGLPGRRAVPSVVFTDTEHVATDRVLTQPWATWIVTPDLFLRDYGPNHLRYRGLHELSYLAPGRFRPDPEVAGEALRRRGRSPDDPFAVVRLVSWNAGHDAGHGGFSDAQRRALVERLSEHVTVFVTSEAELPPDLEPYRLRVPPDRFHALLAEARLAVGEGATVATEAALLGVPALYVSSLVGTMGNFTALEEAGLVECHRDGEPGVERAVKWVRAPGRVDEWRRRRDRFLAGRVDVAQFASGLVERVAAGQPVRPWAESFAKV